jgi:hypothetical protein
MTSATRTPRLPIARYPVIVPPSVNISAGGGNQSRQRIFHLKQMISGTIALAGVFPTKPA